MWQIFKDSLINPKGIIEHRNYKHKFLYLLVLVLILSFPSILSSCINGVIPSETIGSVNSTIENSIIDFELNDGLLEKKSNDVDNVFLYNENACIFFLDIDYSADSETIQNTLVQFKNLSLTDLNLLFTKQGVKLGLYLKGYFFVVDLGNYTEFTNNNIDFSLSKSRTELLKISNLINNIYDKYKGLLLGCTIPVIIIGNLVSLLISIAFPCLLLMLFNRGAIKFKQMFGIGIFCYTPYVLFGILGILFGTLFNYIGEIVSMIYLFICFYGFVRINRESID